MNVVPGRDVHLFLQPAPTAVQLQIYETTETGFRDIAADPTIQYLRFDNTIISVVNGLITPKKLGDTFLLIHLLDAKGTYEGVVRVSVHQEVQQFWIANNRATVREGSNKYVLSVYALFNDPTPNSVGDVSLHSYVQFQSLDTSAFTIDSEGRLTGVKAGKEADAQVQIGSLPAQKVRVHVSEKIDTERRILNLRHGNGQLDDRRNLLFVAEGYTALRESAFNEQVTKIIKALFFTKAQSPYSYLKESFNVWTAFEASPEPGVTVGPPVLTDGMPYPAELPEFASAKWVEVDGQYSVDSLLRLGGLPGPLNVQTLAEALTAWKGMQIKPGMMFDKKRLTQAGFDRWKQQRIDRLLRPKDTVFGLIRSRRLSDPEPAPPDENWFVPPGSTVELLPDSRRTSGPGNFADDVANYVQTLRFGNDITAANFNPSAMWSQAGKDRGLVFFLVDDDIVGGASVGDINGYDYGAIGSRPQSRTLTVTGSFPFDHDPTINPPDFDEPFTTAVLAHEMGHVLGLDDEYEGGYGRPGKPDQQPLIDFIEKHANVTHLSAVAGSVGGTAIDVPGVQWNWKQVDRISTVVEVKAPLATGPVAKQVQVTLVLGAGSAWTGLEGQFPGARVFLRTPDIDLPSLKLSPPLRLTGISGDVLTLDAQGTDAVTFGDFPIGSTVFASVPTAPDIKIIDISHVKWNWERIARSSTVIDVKAPLATGTIAKQVQVTLAFDQGARWNGLEQQFPGARLFLRAPNLNRAKFKMSPPLRVTALAGDALTLETDGSDVVTFGDFPRGSALYLPKKDKAGQIMRLIAPPVATRLASGVFSSRPPALCDVPDLQEEYPPDDIAGYSYPRDRSSVIAAYEGGANFNCDVYRPTGMCKMRRGYRWEIDNRFVDELMHGVRDVPFCFVCKYYLVHLVNPSALGLLDREYPEDC